MRRSIREKAKTFHGKGMKEKEKEKGESETLSSAVSAKSEKLVIHHADLEG